MKGGVEYILCNSELGWWKPVQKNIFEESPRGYI